MHRNRTPSSPSESNDKLLPPHMAALRQAIKPTVYDIRPITVISPSIAPLSRCVCVHSRGSILLRHRSLLLLLSWSQSSSITLVLPSSEEKHILYGEQQPWGGFQDSPSSIPETPGARFAAFLEATFTSTRLERLPSPTQQEGANLARRRRRRRGG